MVLAFELSASLGLCSTADAKAAKAHLDAVGLPTRPGQIADSSFTVDSLMGHMMQDKKVKEGEITFVLAEGIGKACLKRGVPDAAVKDILEQALLDVPAG
jgi:3-dehydroquinate synthase